MYGAPLVLEIRHGAVLFLPYCLTSERTGTGPAGRALVPTTQPTTSDSSQGLVGWLDGRGGNPRRRIRYEVPINPLGALFNSGGIPGGGEKKKRKPTKSVSYFLGALSRFFRTFLKIAPEGPEPP